MNWTPLQHLGSWIVHTVCERDQNDFQAYAIKEWRRDPEYWNEVGWSKLYTQFLDNRKDGAR